MASKSWLLISRGAQKNERETIFERLEIICSQVWDDGCAGYGHSGEALGVGCARLRRAERGGRDAERVHRAEWADANSRDRGPIQYYGPTEVCDQPTRTLLLERGK